MREQERSVKVGPHRTAREVCQLQCAPRRFKCMTGEGRARLPQFLQDLARRALGRDLSGWNLDLAPDAPKGACEPIRSDAHCDVGVIKSTGLSYESPLGLRPGQDARRPSRIGPSASDRRGL